MTSTDQSSEPTSPPQAALGVEMKLEVVTLPVSDVDRAKSFYQSLGWRLDGDFAFGDDIRAFLSYVFGVVIVGGSVNLIAGLVR